MNYAQIAIRSIKHRLLASSLTAFSMSLGVMMVVAVLSIYGIVETSFRSNATLGYNMIVGAAKGGEMQLTLNTVYYLSKPNENIPYTYYMEFLDEDGRAEGLAHSVGNKAHTLEWELTEAQSVAASAAMAPGGGLVASLLSGISLEETQPLPVREGDGKFSDYTQFVIPVCLGDYYGIYRVVGTTPDMFEKLRFGPELEKQYKFAQGRNFQSKSDKYGYFEAVVGAKVARAKGLKIGDGIAPTHGDPEGAGHGRKFYVVGILAATGTPNDRAVFVNINGFYLMEGHSKPPAEDEESEDEEDDEDETDESKKDADVPEDENAPPPGSNDEHLTDLEKLPLEGREVTALLVRTEPIFAMGLPNLINESGEAQAVLPIGQIYNLFDRMIKPLQTVLLIITGLICVVSSVSILVSIYNSMTDRRHEIAVMRALGAGRSTVMMIILLEAIFLALGGGGFGWIMGHSLNFIASGYIEAETGVTIGFFDMVTVEWYLIPSLILLAIVVGILPSIVAYQTDVAASLGE